jgi:ureidoacrylate peracid hydrolase
MDTERIALVLINLQNDFLHGEGAFARANVFLPSSRALIEQLIKIVSAVREAGGKTISAQFNLVADKDNIPIIPEDLKKKWPFLTRGDFQSGRWGCQLIDELSPADYQVFKISGSAFEMTHLDWLLKKLGIDTLIFGGILVNEGIAMTLQSAHDLKYRTILLSDGVADFYKDTHQKALESLKPICELMSCQEMMASLKKNRLKVEE